MKKFQKVGGGGLSPMVSPALSVRAYISKPHEQSIFKISMLGFARSGRGASEILNI